MDNIYSEILREEDSTIEITDLRWGHRESRYSDQPYTLIKIIDQFGRKITAAGQWVEDWKIGDVIEGILQEKVSVKTEDGQKDESIFTSLYLKNPESRY